MPEGRSRLRVLHVTPGLPRFSGPAAVALGLCRGLAAHGVDVTLYTTDFGREGEVALDQPIQHDGFDCYYFPYAPVASWYLYSSAMRYRLKQLVQSFDLVHIHGTWLYPTAVASAVARRFGVPYIIRPRGNLNRHAMRQKRRRKLLYAWLVERRNLDRAAAIQFANDDEAEEASEFRLAAPRLIVSNAVDVPEAELLARLKGRFRALFPDLMGKTVVLFLGRINPIKGLDRLISAFAEVIRTQPECRLVMAGPDTNGFSHQVQAWLEQYGLRSFALLPGPLDGEDKLAALADSDIFCLPSYQEAHSIALTEALACSLPAVITNTARGPDIEAAGAGLVCSGDPSSLSAALLRLVCDREMREISAQNARRLVEERYTWVRVADIQIKAYESILAASCSEVIGG